MIRLHCLTDKLGDLKTANITTDAIIEYCAERHIIPPPGVVDAVWSSTPDNSPLRRLLRQCYVHNSFESAFEDADEWRLPRPFLLEVLREPHRLLSNATTLCKVRDLFLDAFSEDRRCSYYQHDDLCPPRPIVSQGEAEEDGAQD
jgi:hypothetical protein